MRRVAVATCTGDDVDPDSPLLLAALDARGLHAELAAWDDGGVDWDGFDLVVVRSTWDYVSRRDEFLDWARGVARLANPYPVIEYSTDKHYLADLAARGYPVVPSRFCDVGATPSFPAGDFVVKPCIGAGSMDADRYGPGEHDLARAHVGRLHGQGRDVLIQPYIGSVDDGGERALIFIGGTFSHAMTKGAMLNVALSDRDVLYRRERMSRASGEADSLALALAIFDDEQFADLLYARVDVVATEQGWALMELELVEPSLFLSYDDAAPAKLADAVARRLG